MANQYFQHDYNARNSLQIQALLSEHGTEGLGIFWAVVEVLHEKRNKLPLKNYVYSGIADQIKSDAKKVENVIKFCIDVCELFTEKRGFLSSTRVKRNIIKRLDISKTRAKVGKHGANVKQKQAKERKGKESKGKEIKEKEIKEKGIFPAQNFEIDLPEFEVSKAVEYLTITKNVKATPEMVGSLWETFKIKNFTGQKFYKSEREIITHFFESLKFQNLENGTYRQVNSAGNGAGKLGTSAARNKASREY